MIEERVNDEEADVVFMLSEGPMDEFEVSLRATL